MINQAEYTLGPDGELLCHHYEQCRLEAYPDPASPYAVAKRAGRDPTGLSPEPVTIGWGDTGGWKLGDTITQEEADERFRSRMDLEFGPVVQQAVIATIAQCQFDALCALVYNIGPTNFRSSTLLRLLNKGDYAGAAAQFLSWNRAGGKIMKGLQRRRWAEHLVFLGGSAAEAVVAAERKYP